MDNPSCLKCGGVGQILFERDGRNFAKPCECQLQGRLERIRQRAEIPPLYQDATLENFEIPDNTIARHALPGVLLAVENYVLEFPHPSRPGLLLIGNPGTGKTHLAVGALRKIIAKGFEGLFCDYQDLLNRIRSRYDAPSNSADREAYREALEAEVLLLDDLGAHRVTDWVQDTITSIVTWRCNQRKPLIATTNLSDPAAGNNPEEQPRLGKPDYRITLAEQIGPQARSRLFEMCTVIQMPVVADYRLRMVKRR
jgi:DNA replication protein DnaC